jgi:tetratricopeptide (TPR) repeat protein
LMRDLLSLGSTGTAAALSAMEADQAREILAQLAVIGRFRKGTAPWVAYEFSRAAFDIGTGRNRAGADRYRMLREILKRDDIRGLDPSVREIYRLACLYGQAQGEISKGSPLAVELAEELLAGHPFYASHAESTIMAYYAMRGEQDKADTHRERAELAALRGGMSWSAVTVLTARCAYNFKWSRNAIGLMRTIPEFERLSHVAPNMLLFRDLARAYLALLRGNAARSVQLYQRVLNDPRHESLATCWLDHAHYAQALCAQGRFELAKQACLKALQLAPDDGSGDLRYNIALQQLAIVEAQLGDFAAAERRLEGCLAQLGAVDSPMLVGSLHRDCAQVALLARDEGKFASHLEAMSEHYRKTHNPWLIRQCEQLAQEGRRAGLGAGVQVATAALDAEAQAALQAIGVSGVVTTDRASLPATELEADMLRPTTHIDFE